MIPLWAASGAAGFTAASGNVVTLLATTEYIEDAGSISFSHTFDGNCDFAAIVVNAIASVGEPFIDPLSMTVDGVSTTEQASSNYSSSFSEGTYIHTIDGPTTGSAVTVAASNESSSQVYEIIIFEFSGTLYIGNTYQESNTGQASLSSSLATASISVSAGSFVVYSVTEGDNFTGDDVTALSNSSGFAGQADTVDSTYYAGGAGVVEYASSGTQSETWTIATNNPFNYNAAVEISLEP